MEEDICMLKDIQQDLRLFTQHQMFSSLFLTVDVMGYLLQVPVAALASPQ